VRRWPRLRLWSLHPEHLDPAGLVALWREGLLAQAVLAGLTRGYTNHPQLLRFREHERPRDAIAAYLHEVAAEASRRGYRFDVTKLPERCEVAALRVTREQLAYEWDHLQSKLRARSEEWLARALRAKTPRAHPSFVVVPGPVAEWERRR
jgi:Pyrimidine dimer DNA glycosylase